MPDDEYHLEQIEYHTACLRGEEESDDGDMVTPSDIRLPTRQDLFLFRKKLGLSQEEVSDELGISQTTVSQTERGGNNPNMETVARLLRFYSREWRRETIEVES